MKRIPAWLRSTATCAFIALLPTFAEAAATLVGTVDLDAGSPPRRFAKRYPASGIAAEMAKPEQVAVVYLEGTFDLAAFPKPANPPEMKQEGFAFHPSVLPIMVGSRVMFPNLDDTYHNVFSYSPTKRFDLGRYTNDQNVPEVTFEKPGVVKVFCEIHEHMRSTILVLETPYFTSTNSEGAFSLADVPAGKYTAVAWINERTILRTPVTVPASGEVRFTFDSRNSR